MARAVHIFVSGRVQGVFFRQTLKAVALKNGASGWVRNLDDGRVEAHIEGDGVDAVVSWARTGPAGSRVDSLDESPAEPEGISGFEVRY